MELIKSVVQFIPELSTDISPEERAKIIKTILIVCGVAYIADKCFDYLKSTSVNLQGSNVVALDSSAVVLTE